MNSKTYHRLNWHQPPWGTDPNDWLDRDGLGRPDGTPVRITKGSGAQFVIRVGSDHVEKPDGILPATARLNALEVGQWA